MSIDKKMCERNTEMESLNTEIEYLNTEMKSLNIEFSSTETESSNTDVIITKRNILVNTYEQYIKDEKKIFEETTFSIMSIGSYMRMLKNRSNEDIKQLANVYLTIPNNVPLSDIETYIISKMDLFFNFLGFVLTKELMEDIKICMLNSEICAKTVILYSNFKTNSNKIKSVMQEIRELEKNNNLSSINLPSCIPDDVL